MPDRPPILTDATRAKITMNPIAFNALVREAHMLRGQTAAALTELRNASCQITSLGGNVESIDKVIAELEKTS